MAIRDFISAIPKVELNLHLTGALRKESLLLIANQNGVPAQMPDFAQWVELLDRPDPTRFEEIASMAGSWVMYPEDLALVIYDIGVALSKQNVRYAEISLAPSDFVGSARMNFDAFIDALNDGRDRALRAWNVDLSWILCVRRDNPRAGDDVARWASGNAARLRNVVAMGLIGAEEAQPVGQFLRAFGTARKKDVLTVADAGEQLGVTGIRDAIDELQPNRLVNAWRIVDDDALLAQVAEARTPLVISLRRALSTGQLTKGGASSLRPLFAGDLALVLACDNPSLYQSNLVEEYVTAHETFDLSVEQLTQVARRSIECSFMDAERKESMLRSFDFEANAAQAKYLSAD